MTKNTLKNPKKLPQNLKITKNDQKITRGIYISVTSSSSPGFIYLRASHMIQGKKDDMTSKSGPCL
jgi:hypothetical protein